MQDKQKVLIDYMAVDKKLKADVLDARVVKGMFEGLDHNAVQVRMIMNEWRV